MPRLVKHSAKSPVQIKVGRKSKWICRCGLSKRMPYCDGSHKQCVNECPSKVYGYDDQGKQIEVDSSKLTCSSCACCN